MHKGRESLKEEENSPKRRKLSSQGPRTTEAFTTLDVGGFGDMEVPEIHLDDVESNLKRLLLDVAQYIETGPRHNTYESSVAAPDGVADSPIVLRFTGGWVRDKLLGIGSQDIDVGINNMTGYQFGLKMQEYLKISGNLIKYGIGRKRRSSVASSSTRPHDAVELGDDAEGVEAMGALHKIEANPEKSKHLETVTTRVLGLSIDLVNLRKESYSEDSRNPQMTFGTPEEDALRRDATVNALFYNLNTSSLEDFTGRGLSDMRSKIIRTPLEPHRTFMDDPLRVLRLIRFASRLGYAVDPKTASAMNDDAVRAALQTKISKERIGDELEKMLKGPDPRTALELIHRENLYLTIFPATETLSGLQPTIDRWDCVYEFMNIMVGSSTAVSGESDPIQIISSILLPDVQNRHMAWYLAAIVPWVNATVQDQSKSGTKTKHPLPAIVARDGIRISNKIYQMITTGTQNAGEVINFIRMTTTQNHSPESSTTESGHIGRDTLGMAIRDWGSSWRMQVLLAFLLEIIRHERCEMPAGYDSLIHDFAVFLEKVKEYDLLEVHSLKPLLDGTTLAKALDTKPGPWLKKALDSLMAWQLRNPGLTDTKRVLEEVESHRESWTRQVLLSLLSDIIRYDRCDMSIGYDSLIHNYAVLLEKVKEFDPLKFQSSKLSLNGSQLEKGLVHILRDSIRPLFAKSKNPAVTSQGRKANFPLPTRVNPLRDEKEVKPWKFEKPYIMTVFRWVLQNLNQALVEENWPLIIPPLLTIMDDHSPPIKAKGCEMLLLLLHTTSSALLARTGLGDVFEDAVMPCLLYLPSLTPQDESLELLAQAYPALIALGRVRYPSQEQYRAKMDYLDRIFRSGIMTGYSHCSENVYVTRLLVDQLAVLVEEMGLWSVKHLKYIIPILSDILAAPFGPAYPPLLLSAAQALHVVILNDWPRLTSYKAEILRGLAFCWCRIVGEEEDDEEKKEERKTDEQDLPAVKVALTHAFSLLRAAIKDEADLLPDLEVLARIDGRVRGLLGEDREGRHLRKEGLEGGFDDDEEAL